MLNLVQSVWLFVIVIYLFGTETSFIKFFIAADNENDKKKIYSTALILLFVTSSVFSIVLFFLSGAIESLINFENPQKGIYLIKIMSIMLFFDALFRFPLLLLRAELKAKKYISLSILSLIVNVLMNIIFITVLKMGVEAVLYSYIISVLITFLAGIIVTSNYLSPVFSFDAAKKLFIYGNKFIYIGLFTLVIDLSDRFFLKYFFNENIVGIYSANYRLATVMGLFVAAFRFAWTPYFLNLEKNPENKNIIAGIFSNLIFTGMFLFLFFSFFTSPIAKISFGSFSILDVKYQEGLFIIPVVLLAYFFSGMYSALNAAPFYADKTSRLLLITAEGLVINLLLNIFLIKKFGMFGAALSTLITYLIMSVHIYFVSQKIYNIKFDIKKISIIFLFTVISYLIHLIISINFSNQILLISDIFNIILYITFLIIFRVIKLSTVKSVFIKNI